MWQLESTHDLTNESLLALFEERIAALKVSRYCSVAAAERLAEALLADPSRRNHEARWQRADVGASEFERTDVDRVGPFDSVPEGDGESESVALLRRLRAAVAPELGPIDRLRLELDELLPLGASLQRDDDGRPRLAGVGRIMEHSEEIVHADVGRRNCLTANVYLRVPHDGGAVRIWQYDGEYRDAGVSYRFADGEIPAHMASCIVHPESGDLVIWNPALPHAVLDFEDAPRVTLQVWMQWVGNESDGAFGIRLLS